MAHNHSRRACRLPITGRSRAFAEPIATEEVIRATLKSLAAALAGVLEKRDEGARRLEAVFFRADGAVRRIAIDMGIPTREPAVIERLFREKLEALADPLVPGFGFDLIRLSASRVELAHCEVADFDASVNDESRHQLSGGIVSPRIWQPAHSRLPAQRHAYSRSGLGSGAGTICAANKTNVEKTP